MEKIRGFVYPSLITKKAMAFGVATVLVATIILDSTDIVPLNIFPDITKTIWYTEVDATFGAQNKDVIKESLTVKNRFVKGIFLFFKPSAVVNEKEKLTPPTYVGVVNFTTVMELFDETETLVWSHVARLTGLGRKRFQITLTDDIVAPGCTYTMRFTTRLKVTPNIGTVVVDLTRSFEETFTSLNEVSRERFLKYVGKPTDGLDEDYYSSLLQSMHAQQGSLFMDDSLNLTTIEAAFEYICGQITYTKDVKLYGQREYFAKASETMMNGAGDCEDKSILLASTLYWQGIDRQAKVVIGEVLGRGHAWVEARDRVYDPTNNIVAEKSDYYTYVTTVYFHFSYNDFSLLTDAESSIGS